MLVVTFFIRAFVPDTIKPFPEVDEIMIELLLMFQGIIAENLTRLANSENRK